MGFGFLGWVLFFLIFHFLRRNLLSSPCGPAADQDYGQLSRVPSDPLLDGPTSFTALASALWEVEFVGLGHWKKPMVQIVYLQTLPLCVCQVVIGGERKPNPPDTHLVHDWQIYDRTQFPPFVWQRVAGLWDCVSAFLPANSSSWIQRTGNDLVKGFQWQLTEFLLITLFLSSPSGYFCSKPQVVVKWHWRWVVTNIWCVCHGEAFISVESMI